MLTFYKTSKMSTWRPRDGRNTARLNMNDFVLGIIADTRYYSCKIPQDCSWPQQRYSLGVYETLIERLESRGDFTWLELVDDSQEYYYNCWNRLDNKCFVEFVAGLLLTVPMLHKALRISAKTLVNRYVLKLFFFFAFTSVHLSEVHSQHCLQLQSQIVLIILATAFRSTAF